MKKFITIALLAFTFSAFAQERCVLSFNLLPVDNPKVRVVSTNEISLCPFDSVLLDAGNPGCSYLWSNGSRSRFLKVTTSGIAYDEQEYDVTVMDPVTGCSGSSSMKVTFTFADCIFGIEDVSKNSEVKIYPNPSSNGVFSAELNGFKGHVTVEIHSSLGQLVKTETIEGSASLRYLVNLEGQSAGVYMMKVSDDRSTSVQKLIIR